MNTTTFWEDVGMVGQSRSGDSGWMGKLGVGVAELRARLALTVEGWRERRQLVNELAYLQRQGELERTLSDSGISPSDLPRLLRAHPRTPQQLAEMMRRLGIARAALAGDTARIEALRAIEWRCGECANWRECRAWLEEPTAAATYRTFCPNAEALDNLRTAAASGAAPGQRRGILAELDRAGRD